MKPKKKPKDDMKYIGWILVLIAIGLLCLSFQMLIVQSKINTLEHYKLFDKEINFSSYPNGIYNPNEKYMCVWLEGRSIEDIMRTTDHEYLHYMIDVDYEHFCGVKKLQE